MNFFGRNRTVVVSLLFAMVLVVSQRSASAGYLATNLGAGNSYNTSNSYTLSGPNSVAGLGYGLAVEFQISGGTSAAFGSAQLALEYHSGANALDVLLMSDASGVPGLTLETIHLTNIPVGPALVTATSVTNTVLTPGTHYWLASVASNDTYMSWMYNSQGATNHLAYRTDSGSGPSAWATAPGNPDIAFGISATNTSAVPGPPSLALVGFGLASLASYRARRKGRSC